MNISGIYKIQSIIKPERCYIGSAVCISKRWNQHLHYLRKGNHQSVKLQRHYNKYGEIDLQFSILLGCEKEDLIKIEQYFLDSYIPHFNNCKKAGSQLGTKRTIESKNKMSKSQEGNKNAFGSKRIAWNKNLKGIYSKETLKKMRDKKLGIKQSIEQRKKESESGKEAWKLRKSNNLRIA